MTGQQHREMVKILKQERRVLEALGKPEKHIKLLLTDLMGQIKRGNK